MGAAVARILVEDPEGGTQVPFLRGILTRSLQKSGLSFEEAYRLATEIRRDLGDSGVITADDLRERVHQLLKKRYDARVASRYERQAEPPTLIQVEHLDGRTTPFSSEQHRRCLETIGLTAEESLAVVQKLRQHLVNKRVESTTSEHLSQLTYRYLRQTRSLGPAVALRWKVWIDFVRSGRPLILLIGGTSGCGKSTIATALANQLDIVRTQSTDMLREVMRTMLSDRLLPILHTSSFNAWRTLPEHERSLADDENSVLAEGFLAQADLLSVAIEAVTTRALRERVSLILEGVHVHANLVERIPNDSDAVIAPIMLAVLKRRNLRERIKGRGTRAPQRRSARYLEHFDEIWQLQSFLLSEADRAKIPIIVNDDREQAIREIMRTVIDQLSKDFKG